MQSMALTISTSSPLLKSPRQWNPSFFHGFIPKRLFCSSSYQNNFKNSVNESGSSFWPARSWSFSSSSFSSSKISPWTGASHLASDSGKSAFVVAASVPESAGEDGGLKKTLRLEMLMSLWYLLNTCFNIFNKQVCYMILQKVSPVTHSFSNFVKRVALSVSSIIFFQTPVSAPINSSAGQLEDIEIHEKDLESEDSLLDLYERWRSCYGVTRGLEEKNERFKVFKQNVEYIYRANQYLSYELGLNPFSDMTEEEVKKMFGLRPYTDKELEVMRKCQD